MPVPWDGEAAGHADLVEANLAGLLRQLAADAPSRRPPSVADAQAWHRAVYRGVPLPVPYFAGEVRDSDPRFPELVDYEVEVAGRRAVPAADIPAALGRFQAELRRRVVRIDADTTAGWTNDDLLAVLRLCAWAHGEWARLHPFANGNGRIARLWANWCALRFGLPPFVRLRPRPVGLDYAMAAQASMEGDHGPMVGVFARLLESALVEAGQPLEPPAATRAP